MLRFGTDGVRGDAETQLPSQFVVALGRAAAQLLGTEHVFLIGRDTRASGNRIAADLAVGLRAEGANVEQLGVLATPGIAFASQRRGVPAAVISASHNQWRDNGIKLFRAGGFKLDDDAQTAIELALEPLARGTESVSSADAADADEPAHHDCAHREYVEHVTSVLEGRSLDGLRVVLDTANGAASVAAPEIFRALGADVVVLNDQPDGTNINADCGSTHPQQLQLAVTRHRAHVGFALDGDADRCLGVDELGRIVDGDEIMVSLALDLSARGRLAGNAIAVTVLSNLGLHVALSAAGIRVVETDVGDRSVMAAIEAEGLVLGGEQSGHVIVRDKATTGDGTLTAVLVADVIARTARSASELKNQMMVVPQVMVNVRVAVLPNLATADTLWNEVAQVRAVLGAKGRVLVRPSGTEPLIRVMVEATTVELAQAQADRLAAVVRDLSA